MTPGAYLRQSREAAGLSLDDVALRTETLPPVSARSRAEFLGSIEADLVAITVADALGLHTIFPFDWQVLLACCAEHVETEPAAGGAPAPPLRLVPTRAAA